MEAATEQPESDVERKRKSREHELKWFCINPLCMTKWEESLMDANECMVCEYCEQMFCPKETCLSMMDAH